MLNITTITNQEKGSIMLVALLILVLLSIIGLSAANNSTTEVRIATNDHLSKIVFYAAETGIEVGRNALGALKIADPVNWDNLLSETPFTWEGVSVITLDEVIDASNVDNRNVGLATFTLEIRDNDDLDNNLLSDTDNIIILTSTANYTARNAQTEIETMVRYTGPSGYAQEHYSTKNEGITDSGDVGGTQRWN